MIKVIKRNGQKVEYNGERIVTAISKSMSEGETGIDNEMALLIEQVIFEVIANDDKNIYTVENIQDMIEKELMKHGRYNTAKRYIEYRYERNKNRNKKWEMNDLQKAIFEQKYENNKEGFEGFLDRVSNGNNKIKKLIRDKKFMPAGRILANRGLQKEGRKITYSNCYVVGAPEDNIESIFESSTKLARTYSFGGGCGIDIGKLRPNGSKVNNSAKTTTGACSFMDLYSLVTGLICQSGRRGALMISIPSNHPDIEEFITIKSDLDRVTKANISIRIDNDFMTSVKNKDSYQLEFLIEATGEVIKKEVDANEIFTKLALNNWDFAEPGALYWDTICNWNIVSDYPNFEYAGTNPCAEEPLPKGGSCLLGSINLSEFVINPFTDEACFNYNLFNEAVKTSTVFLNEVLDEGLPLHPLQEQRDTVRDWRQIGLGIMGLADMLIKMGIVYGDEDSFNLCDNIAYNMINSTLQQSALIAKDLGTFPLYNEENTFNSSFIQHNASEETLSLIKKYGLRNSQVLTIAPTGSISTMLGISGGIEPIYQVSYTRKTETLNDGKDTFYKVFTPIARQYMDVNDLHDESELPETFVTAMTLNYEDRIKMQSIWQKRIDASISSTINVKEDFTVEQTKDLYIKAWEAGLKGITIFRDGCKRLGILGNHDVEANVSNLTAKQLKEILDKKIQEELDNDPNKCPVCGGNMNHIGGCAECEDCAYSPCAI